MGKNNCHKKWKSDGRFVKYPLREDDNGQKFIPFCTYSGHIGLIADDHYRKVKCERKGGGKYCGYYRRFRSEELFRTARATETLEVSVVYEAGSSEHHNSSRQ